MKTKRAHLTLIGFIAAASVFGQNSQTHIDSALVACYPFNGNANDLSGNNLNGTVNGAVLTTDRFGKQNSAYYFAGSTSTTNISVPGMSSQFNGSGVSISFWTKKTSYETRAAFLMDPDDVSNRLCVCVYYGNNISNSQVYWDYGDIYSNGRMNFGNCPLPGAAVWDHWVFVASETDNNMKVYRNGLLIQTKSSASTFSASPPRALSIGGGYDVNNGYLWFEGKLDDIRIYKRVLLPSEVNTLYTSTTTCACEAVATPTNATAGSNFCAGSSATLSATGSHSVSWYSSASSTVSIAGGSTYVTPVFTSPATYSYYARSISSCALSEPLAITFTVHPLPAVQIEATSTIVCKGESLTLSAFGATTYTWNTGLSSPSIMVTPAASFIYVVSGMDALTGCSNSASLSVLVSNCVGLHDQRKSDLRVEVHPNPVIDELTLSLGKPVQVIISNSLGQLIYKADHVDGDRIDLSAALPGLYYISANDGSSTSVCRIVKK